MPFLIPMPKIGVSSWKFKDDLELSPKDWSNVKLKITTEYPDENLKTLVRNILQKNEYSRES